MTLQSASQPGTVRRATVADLPRIGAIWHATQRAEDSTLPPLIQTPSLYAHELETNALWVLERAGDTVAFSALVERDSVAFLADLFVDPVYQSQGLGQRLLQHVLPRDGRTVCTVSSGDRRALALYTRSGLHPCWPHLQLLADLPAVARLPTEDVDVVEAQHQDPELVRWDTEISGRRRPEDHAYWLSRRGGIPLWFARRGHVIGYGFAQTHSDDLLHYPETLTLGPLGASTAEEARLCVLAAVEWARHRATRMRIGVTGRQPASTALVTAGFRVASVETFCTTDDPSFVDVRRYISSGGDLF